MGSKTTRLGNKMDKIIEDFAKQNNISKTAASNVLAGLLRPTGEVIKVKINKKRGTKEFQC